MIRRVTWALWAASVCCGLSGCALLSKGDPVVARYFTPEASTGGSEAPRAETAPDGGGRPLRLGRIGATSQLRERIVYRASAEELGFYETARWTERPENYLRRALSRALFEERGFARVVSGPAPTLEAELIAFEEVRGSPRSVRLQVVVTLDDERVTRLEQTITIVRRVPEANSTAAVARALGAALREAVDRIAEQVTNALRTPAQDASVAASPAPSEAP